ncbi:DNA alkylation repair enzyme [bacterium BMS3Abin15]|nr:DNA alkylation repair enzyme [bacterium BMS3Abin15]HDH07638.1 DNA alkylation repair protein [Candidatus Moranbacteria bacterium]HDZ85340.1 DNA alkylation repair protein [Candidatus Moranbacteria bacterium]
MTDLKFLRKELKLKSDPRRAKLLQGFFKTGPGEYGEGDIFLGITVPEVRKTATKFNELKFSDVKKLLGSKIHEERLTALLILVHNFNIGNEAERNKIFKFYLANTKNINNWDLVDLSAHKIVGEHILDRSRNILYKLARSKKLWEKRISIISTFAFIRDNELKDSLKISEILLNDDHDLIHKAVGWVLREVGKKSLATEEKFLKKHYKKMPRTMLRYAIEKFPEKKRKAYLKGNI